MPSVGNCGAPITSTDFSLVTESFFTTSSVVFSSWARITELYFWAHADSSGVIWRGKILIYKCEGTSEMEHLVYETPLINFNSSEAGDFKISHECSLLLPPGEYRLAIWTKYKYLVFTWNEAESGTSFKPKYSWKVNSPPEYLGEITLSLSNTARPLSFCLVYDDLASSEIKLELEGPENANCEYNVELMGSSVELSNLMPFETSLPSGSTVTLRPEEYPEELDYTLIGPSSIAVTNTSYSIRWSQKVVYAAGRYWAFWSDTDNKMYYSSSLDGINWAPKVFLREVNYKYGETCGVFFDGEFLHVHIKDGSKIYLRIGRPNSDGSIDWKADWQVIMDANSTGEGYAVTLTDHSYYYGPSSISYVSWHFAINYSGVGNLDAWWNHSTHDVTENGLWGENITPEEFSGTDWRGSKVLGLPNGEVLILCVKANVKMTEFLYNGSWTSKLATNYEVVNQYPSGGENWSYDAIVDPEGNVHLVYLDSNYKVRYRKRNFQLRGWYDEKLIFEGSRKDHDSKIVLDEETGDLYVFTAHAPSVNHIGLTYYSAKFDKWFPMIDLLNISEGLASPDDSNDVGGAINAPRRVRNNTIPLIYIVNNPEGGKLIKSLIIKIQRPRKWKFQYWENGSTQRIREIVLPASTFTTNYCRLSELGEDLKYEPWIRILRLKTLRLSSDLMKSPHKKDFENLELLISTSKFLSKHLSSELRLITKLISSFLSVYKYSVSLLRSLNFARILLRHFKVKIMEKDRYVRRRND